MLIHAGTGGVGMAAVQLARHWGAEVFVTASRGKWDTLRAMGFDDDHIGDSRTLEFEEKFLAVTGGRGVDVVLDSLAGEFVDASLRLLVRWWAVHRDGQDRHPRRAGDRRGNIPGWPTGRSTCSRRARSASRRSWPRYARCLTAGVLQPLPVKTWDVRRAAEAFRFMSQARHIGKVVLTMPAALAVSWRGARCWSPGAPGWSVRCWPGTWSARIGWVMWCWSAGVGTARRGPRSWPPS